MNRFRYGLLLGWFWLLASASLHADVLDLAQFTIVQQQDSNFTLVARLPESGDASLPVSWPSSCTVSSGDVSSVGSAFSVSFDADCGNEGGEIQTRWGSDGAMLQVVLTDGGTASSILPGGPRGARITVPDWQSTAELQIDGFWNTAQSYLGLGTIHVLEGWDHLAFVLCLALLAKGMSLLWLITAFTVGHSISLALAHFGILNVPIVPVEAIIALSVVFMAREALLAHRAKSGPMLGGEQRKDKSLRWKLGVTAGFGLIHGLGFASVLGSLGVSASQTVTALAFFNIGVEVGQIFFVLVVLGLMALMRKIRIEKQSTRLATCLVGGMGLFWTIERVVYGV